MSPEAQQIAIAEACGWRRESEIPDEYDNFAWWSPKDRKGMSEIARQADIPNFIGSLDAMHEAEKVLTWDEQHRMIIYLIGCNKEDAWTLAWDSVWLASHATPAHRAEAFLRTIGKWEDAP